MASSALVSPFPQVEREKRSVEQKVSLPAGFLIASRTLGGVGLFPLGDRLGFVVAHLAIHAGAILAHDVVGRAALVVRQALIDPFNVVGGRRVGLTPGECGSYKCATGGN